MTQLTITPKVADKTARFKGTIAAGEHVAVTIKGGAAWLGDGEDEHTPVLRVIDCTTRRTLAVFPRPDNVLVDGEDPDEWEISQEDADDLACTLNLNTLRMVAAARHMLRVPVLFVLGDTEDPRTLYFCDRYVVEYWPERIGDDAPYDLDNWPKKIDEWTELVTDWTARLNAMKLFATREGNPQSGNPYVEITLNDGTGAEDTKVKIFDGEVSAAQLASAVSALEGAIADKQDALTFDDAPTADSANPVKSGGVKTAIDTVATNLSTHTGNSGIHVTADQKTAWTAKYDKPSGGIPASDLAGEITKAKLTASVRASLGKADTAVQPDALAAYIKDAEYDSDEKKILLKNGSTTVAYIDATAFIKDGMVSSVTISDGNLVITFNTDAGAEPISIPLTSIFNPANYYDKTAADGRFVQKETGKGLVAVDATLATQGAAADAKAVGDAVLLNEREYTLWEVLRDGVDVTAQVRQPEYDGGPSNIWLIYCIDGDYYDPIIAGSPEATSLTWSSETEEQQTWVAHTYTATRKALPHYVLGSQTTKPIASVATVAEALVGKQDALSAAQLAQIAAVPGKADKAELPYRLVEPGAWEFSRIPTGYTRVRMKFETGVWYFCLGTSSTWENVWWNVTGDGSNDADALTLECGYYNGEDDESFTATRASLPGHLLDRAGNRVVVTGDTTLTLPAANPGYLRDFLVRLEISGSTVPTITFQGQGSEAPNGADEITYETDGDAFPVPDDGVWLYAFTETKAHTFAVALKPVTTVTQGGS